MGFTPFSPVQYAPAASVLVNQAATAAGGYALVNGTGDIITWTAPNDGKNHQVFIPTTMDITVAETGGQITCHMTAPDSTAATPQVQGAAQSTGVKTGLFGAVVAPGTTVTVHQETALTVGTAVLWASIWAN